VTATTSGRHLTSSRNRAEVLSLYRECLRTARHFHWADPDTGQPWNARLRDAARQEFQQARNETDPLVIARLLVTGRDCVQQVQNKFRDATQAAWQRIAQDTNPDASTERSDTPKDPRTRRGPGPWP
jgi:hypothetical protein